MHFQFETEQWLPLPPTQVFAFFADPANLPPLMPGWQKTRIDAMTLVPPPLPPPGVEGKVAAGDGTELKITARPVPFSPIRTTWLARIEAFHWNEGFCDVQLKGPFRYWRHCHSVRPAPDPKDSNRFGSLVRDHVEYELPLLRNSPLINRLFALPALRKLFRFRQSKAYELLTLSGVPK